MLTGIGLVASLPLGDIAGGFALSPAAMVGASKNIESKISNHQEIVTLAVEKRDTVLCGGSVCKLSPEALKGGFKWPQKW